MDFALLVYLAWLLIYRAVETYARRAWAPKQPPRRRDLSIYLIVAPFYAAILGCALEHAITRTPPPWINLALGSLAFAVGVGLRWLGHRDLGGSFSERVETYEVHPLITTGLYADIRHPLYLGNLFLFGAMPLLLACRWGWIPSALGIIGVLVRLRHEERFLAHELPGYAEYMQRTKALIPKIW